MAMFRALIVLAIASTALGDDDDFTVECKSGRPLAQDGTEYAMSHSASEVIDHGYAKKTQAMSGMMYNVGMMIGFASYAVQGVNVIRDGISEAADRMDKSGKHEIPWTKRLAAFVIDPNLISFFSSGLSFIVLQDFYARLYQGNPMGVWTVNASSLDDGGNLVCQRYGVIADDAEAAMQLGKCHKFPPHVSGCKEDYLSHAEYSVGWGDDACDQKDPVIVQQTLFGGWSATSLQFAFFLGCLLRFFDAVTTFYFDWMKHGVCIKFGVLDLYDWARKATLEFAMLRGYQWKDIGGLEKLKEDDENLGVYLKKNWSNGCCPKCLDFLNLPNMIDRFGWTAKVISNVASDSLFAVLTMTSLHVSVEEGCISMNTAIGFSALTNVVNIFIGTVGLIFFFIIVIVVYHMSEALYECTCDTPVEDARCYFRIFAWCIYFLAVLSIGGFWLNVLSLLIDGDLSAQGCAGIMLEIFGMVGEIAEGYEDERDKDQSDKEGGTSGPSATTMGNIA